MNFYEYRIVKRPAKTPEELDQFMPQRGVPGQIDGLSNKIYWRDALPHGCPTLELCSQMMKSIQIFDARETQGEVVWKA